MLKFPVWVRGKDEKDYLIFSDRIERREGMLEINELLAKVSRWKSQALFQFKCYDLWRDLDEEATYILPQKRVGVTRFCVFPWLFA